MRAGRLLVALVLAALLAGCGVLPSEGPVEQVGQVAERAGSASTARFLPPGPRRGDSQQDIASGFLVAMTGNPLGVPIARRFLTADSQDSWRPSRRIIVYDSSQVTTDKTPDRVTLRLGGVRRLDDRGGWIGGGDDVDEQLSLRLRVEDGEWRLSDPPDALIVPRWWFTGNYRPMSLYFFDRTERVLVPNRVYVPAGDDAATALVRGLLRGPGAALAPVTRTAIPSGTGLELSVVVGPGGVADVPLSGRVAALPADRLARLLAQVTTTLRQVPDVRRVRLLNRDAPLTLPNGRRTVPVDYGAVWSPSVRGSSDAVYGLRDSRVVSGQGSGSAVDGAFGMSGLALRSIGVTVPGDAVTGVGADGRSVLSAPQSGAGAAAPRRVYTGRDVLPPAYDMFGALWLVDRTANGSKVVLVERGVARTVRVPGLSGSTVTAFRVSRDGTRLVALVDSGSGPDRLLLSYLSRGNGGTLVRASSAQEVPGVPAELGDLVDVAWFGPSDLAVLGHPSAGLSEVTFVTVDGSPGDPDLVPPDTWRGQAQGLVGSYDPELPLLLSTPGGRLLRLDRSSSRWRGGDLAPGLDAATYAG